MRSFSVTSTNIAISHILLTRCSAVAERPRCRVR